MSGMAENLSVNSDCGTHSGGRNGGWQYPPAGPAVCCTGADAAIELLDLFPIVLKELDAIPAKVAYFRTL